MAFYLCYGCDKSQFSLEVPTVCVYKYIFIIILRSFNHSWSGSIPADGLFGLFIKEKTALTALRDSIQQELSLRTDNCFAWNHKFKGKRIKKRGRWRLHWKMDTGWTQNLTSFYQDISQAVKFQYNTDAKCTKQIQIFKWTRLTSEFFLTSGYGKMQKFELFLEFQVLRLL